IRARRSTVPLADVRIELAPDALEIRGRYMHRSARENSCNVAEGTAHMHSLAVDGELANTLVVDRPAHLEHRHPALHLAEHLYVAKQNDRICERGDVSLGDRGPAHQRGRRRREETRDPLVLD